MKQIKFLGKLALSVLLGVLVLLFVYGSMIDKVIFGFDNPFLMLIDLIIILAIKLFFMALALFTGLAIGYVWMKRRVTNGNALAR
jgi:hypothetical protein